MGETSSEVRTEGGRPGRPPGLLGLAALKELPRLDADLLRELGLHKDKVLRQGLKLLLLALEAHRLGADLRWNTGEVLKEGLLEFLREEENARRLLTALAREERAFLGLADGASAGDLREVVEELYLRDHPRGVVQKLLRKLGPLLATLAPTRLGDLPLDRVPETWAAATPLVGAFRGVFLLLERSYGLDSAAFEQAMAASWVFHFLKEPTGTGDPCSCPFGNVHPYLEAKKVRRGTQVLLYRDGAPAGCTCQVARNQPTGKRELYEASRLNDKGPRVPSPALVKHFPAWYEALAKAWKGGDPEPCPFPEGGYDWDLVAEYRHALWAALASSPHGGKP
ncbi:hypothetical protein TthHC11_20730 (plasmid) [Thermus thermophilus]|uniref:hypothetical protein n=1 Tax=Thermus thermophilus TaxID=274 RepID=UPI00039F6682|nr:hypothetical protein [Thermus thermophilus]BBL94539.1 hypothetical protein TthHC11_20730 [Thermus thermophilus]